MGEGTPARPYDFKERQSEYKQFLEESDVNVVVVGTFSDKTSSVLNEQGLISWLGLDNLWNKLPFYGSGYPSYGFEGKRHSPEWIEQQRQRRLGQKHSEESKRKMSESSKGRVVIEETKRRISETKKNSKLTCPHCGMVGGVSNMRRYHFDHCKQK